jgi:hypothetical protein
VSMNPCINNCTIDKTRAEEQVGTAHPSATLPNFALPFAPFANPVAGSMSVCYDANKKRKPRAEAAFMLALGVCRVER